MANKITKLMLNGEEYDIREYQEGGWQPGVNTIAYYPLNSANTVNDLSGNNYHLTSSGTITFGTYDSIDCCYVNLGMLIADISSTSSQNVTQGIWYKEVNTPNYDNAPITSFWHSGVGDYNGIVRANGRPNNKHGIVASCNNGSIDTISTTVDNNWMCLFVTYDGTNCKLYKNGQLIDTLSTSYNVNFYKVFISRRASDFDRSIKGYISNAIFENKVRTDTEVANYYDQTKSLYGIS